MIGLTGKQRAILEFIEDFRAKNGAPPSIGEIADAFSVSHPTIFQHINALQKKGYANRTRKSRSIRLSPDCPVSKKPSAVFSVPFYANVEELMDSNPGSWINIDGVFWGIKSPEGVFCVKVNSEELSSVGIFCGDVLLAFETTSRLSGGDIGINLSHGASFGKIFVCGQEARARGGNYFDGRKAKVLGALRVFPRKI